MPGFQLWCFPELGRAGEIRVEDLLQQGFDGRGIRESQVDFLVDLQAELVEVCRSEAGPAIVDRRLDMGHTRVNIYP